MADYDMYIKNGRFIIPKLQVNYLMDNNESVLPAMPEVTETTVRIAGRDGEMFLKGTYEPMSFEIVCYTADNLTLEEKETQEKEITNFFYNERDKVKKLGFVYSDDNQKFYNVRYVGALTRTNFPKHLKFSIPLRASFPYAMDVNLSHYEGNSTFTSNTIKDCGVQIKIKGPATNPKISLNNFEILYENSILEGDTLVIDSSKSTITLIDSKGVETNAMRYYNHQFPKIQNGDNTLKIISGIDNEKNVSVEWYDLKL